MNKRPELYLIRGAKRRRSESSTACAKPARTKLLRTSGRRTVSGASCAPADEQPRQERVAPGSKISASPARAGRMDRLERFYKIDQLLKERKVVSFAVFSQVLGMSRASVRRDLEYMRSRFNAPIEYDRELKGYRFEDRARARATSCRACGSTPPRRRRSSPRCSSSTASSPGCSTARCRLVERLRAILGSGDHPGSRSQNG